MIDSDRQTRLEDLRRRNQRSSGILLVVALVMAGLFVYIGMAAS